MKIPHQHLSCKGESCGVLICVEPGEGTQGAPPTWSYAFGPDAALHDGLLAVGDPCPACHIATLIATDIPLGGEDDELPFSKVPTAEEIAGAYTPMMNQLEKMQQKNADRAHLVSEESVMQLTRIADALDRLVGRLAEVSDVDDQGRGAVRVLGELIGGDGDVLVEE